MTWPLMAARSGARSTSTRAAGDCEVTMGRIFYPFRSAANPSPGAAIKVIRAGLLDLRRPRYEISDRRPEMGGTAVVRWV